MKFSLKTNNINNRPKFNNEPVDSTDIKFSDRDVYDIFFIHNITHKINTFFGWYEYLFLHNLTMDVTVHFEDSHCGYKDGTVGHLITGDFTFKGVPKQATEITLTNDRNFSIKLNKETVLALMNQAMYKSESRQDNKALRSWIMSWVKQLFQRKNK